MHMKSMERNGVLYEPLSAEGASAISEATRLRPRLGLTGSLGRGNYGDELYVKTYEHWFGGWADLFMLAGLPRQDYFKKYAHELVDLMDAIVLGGGDLLCPYRPNIDRDFINPMYLRRPVHVAGIGVERNKPNVDQTVVERWNNFLSHPSVASISNRDPGSKDWLEEHFDLNVPVTSHPDLVCALPLPKATQPEGAPILGIVTRHIKSAKEYVLLPKIAAKLAERGWRVRHIIGGVRGHGKKDYENAQLVDIEGKEVIYSEDLDDISRAIGECSLLLSMKLHTTVVGTMYGVPTVCVNPAVKAREFMKAAGREDLVFMPSDRKLLDLVDSEILPPEPSKVVQLREEASAALRGLGQRIWSDYRTASPIRERMLSESPEWPEWPS